MKTSLLIVGLLLCGSVLGGECYQHGRHYTHQRILSPHYGIVGVTEGRLIDKRSFLYSASPKTKANFQEYLRWKYGEEQPPVPPTGENAQPLSGPANAEAAKRTLKTECLSCHRQGGNPQGNRILFDAKGELLDVLPWEEINAALLGETSQMPKKGRLPDADLKPLIDWIEAKRLRQVESVAIEEGKE